MRPFGMPQFWFLLLTTQRLDVCLGTNLRRYDRRELISQFNATCRAVAPIAKAINCESARTLSHSRNPIRTARLASRQKPTLC